MADNPLLPGITIPGPSGPGVEPWIFDGLPGLHTQDQYGYEAYTDEYFAILERDRLYELSLLPVLPEVVVPGITPPPSFQGPLPEPFPQPAPSPGGGAGGGGSAPTTTAEPSPARSPYSVPKAGKLRTLRFIMEALAKKLAPVFRNVIPRMPTPMTFLVESLLIGDDLADATLFDPKTLPRAPLPAIINDPLREVIVWSPPAPKAAPSPSSYLLPLIFDFPSPSTISLPQPATLPLPEPFATPLPTTLPVPWPQPFPEMPVVTPLASPVAPTAPFNVGTFLPWESDPFSPSLDIDSNPRGTISPDPAPAPLGALGFAPASNCPPCAKKTESKSKQKRSKCYVKLVREKRDPSKDKSTNWRKIKCQ